MKKTSSEKNKLLKPAVITAVLLLCLGGFFVFFKTGGKKTQDADLSANTEKIVFLNDLSDSVAPPSVSAQSAILIEASSGKLIWSKDPDVRMSMASTTKIMTALVAIENRDISKKIKVSPSAVGVEGSSVYLYPDEQLTLEDLLYAMLLESANDAAAAIAIEVGGSIDGFAEMMNEKARDMGLSDTHFENPHGLDGESHYTTARELAIIACEAYSNETFRRIVSTVKKTIPLNETEGVRLLINHNKLLKGYSGATGIKTGYTKKSGRCLVSSAERDGLTFIAVTLNAPNDWQDHKSMLDYGFSAYESRILCDEGSFSYIMPVIGGDSDHVLLENTEKVTVILPQDASEIKCIVEIDRFLYAPVRAGDIVGRLVFYHDGEAIAESNIIARTDAYRLNAKKSFFEKLFG